MPRPRTPEMVATVTGALTKNPQRARKEPTSAPLGSPPKRLTDVEREAWLELADEMPWLARSDRKGVEIAAKLTARMMTDPDMGVNALAQLRMCLSAMGGFPADRSKVSVPDEESEDPASEFIN